MTVDIKLTTTAQYMRHGSTIGQPLTRRDGEQKVTGAARFAADNHPTGMAYAVIVESKIARGRVISFNMEAAKSHSGMIDVITPAHRPALAMDPDAKFHPGHRHGADDARRVGCTCRRAAGETRLPA